MGTNPTRAVKAGRDGHRYYLDGEPCDGVTGVIGKGYPKPALVDWAARQTAGYAVDNWADLAAVGASEKLRRLERARWDTNKVATARGTLVHDLAAQLAAGLEVDVPDEARGMVDSYLAFAADWVVDELLVELPIINRAQRYMGRPDLVAVLRDGRTWLLDWKTGASGIWPETALQLAAYANAETVLEPDGTESPMPEVDCAGAVWLRADGYDLVPVDIGPAVFRTFLYVRQVALFVGADRSAVIGEPVKAPPALRLEATP